jgi:hypothetical protein
MDESHQSVYSCVSERVSVRIYDVTHASPFGCVPYTVVLGMPRMRPILVSS